MNQPEQPPHPEQPTVETTAIGEGADQQSLQQETAPDLSPRIWVTSQLDEAFGIEHAAWIDAGQPPEQIQADINRLLATSPFTTDTGLPAIDWLISNSQGFGDCPITEHEDLGWISGVAQGIDEHGLAFAAWANVVKEEEYLADFDQAYLGHYDSLHAYIEQLINDLGYDELFKRTAPPSIRPYVKIDITATANDMLLGGDLHALPADDGGVWIFDARE